MGALDSLPKDQILRGVIIRTEKGHVLYTTFTDNKLANNKLRESLIKVGAKIVVYEIRGYREDFRKKIKYLNHLCNLPGVNPLELIKECC